MHTRHKQTTNHCVLFHNELQKQTLQIIVFDNLFFYPFQCYKSIVLMKKSQTTTYNHHNSNIIRANTSKVFFALT